MPDFDVKYGEYLRYFEDCLKRRLNCLSESAPETIKAAMKYAVIGGGKRVRPVLCFAVYEMLGGNFSEMKELALAIEFIHSYSLVHDDLPAMDNDDYRRGKFSTHKKFGEATGILAGDALLNFAFETVFSANDFTDGYVKAARLIADYSGYNGMIGGQVSDIENEKNQTAGEKDLYDIYLNKTAK
ncbi:MAG: polyprenyl synthetase family protein, partial [Clostridia bacterium]|nr:polyprenyl synthetase family protein [Clostridia bacterium]